MAGELRKRVLVVDDTKSNIDILVDCLGEEYEVHAALNGQWAIKIAHDARPDLILLDVMMPDLDGYEVCRRLKADAITADIPIIFVTALQDDEDKLRGFEAGGADFITKPFSIAEVKARIRSHLEAKAYREEILDYQRVLQQRVAERTKELTEAKDRIGKSFLEMVFRLALVAEFRDHDTGAHIMRIGWYAAALASQMNLDDEFARTLKYAATLHDIGKVAIPDNILLKTGPLSAEEWVIMRRHAEIGAEILHGSASQLISLGGEIALSHHERWDGNGYPRGLGGEMIPLSGRIVAVVDAFDAIISKRCYREPWPVDKAVDIITKESGSQFDPTVVEAFISQVEELVSIRDCFADESRQMIMKTFEFVATQAANEDMLARVSPPE